MIYHTPMQPPSQTPQPLSLRRREAARIIRKTFTAFTLADAIWVNDTGQILDTEGAWPQNQLRHHAPQHLADLFPKISRHTWLRYLERSDGDGTLIHTELATATATPFPVVLSLHPHHWPSGTEILILLRPKPEDGLTAWSPATLETLSDFLGQGVCLWDFRTQHLRLSPQAQQHFNLPTTMGLLSLEAWFSSIHPLDRPSIEGLFQSCLRGEVEHFTAQFQIRFQSGPWHLIEMRGRCTQSPEGPIAIASLSPPSHAPAASSTDQKQNPKLDFIHETLEDLAARPGPVGYALAAIAIQCNRALHPDESQRLQHALTDISVQRLNTHCPIDHFVVVLDEQWLIVIFPELPDAAEAQKHTDTLIAHLRAPTTLGAYNIRPIVHAGLRTSFVESQDAASFLDSALFALRQAQERKAIRALAFSRAIRERAIRELDLDYDLSLAQARSELYLSYQPIFDVHSGDILGFEALCRWQHPRFGLVSPSEFIPIAEKNGLIIPIGLWTLRRACLDAAHWPDPTWVAVNISPTQLTHPDFLSELQAILAETGFPAHRLHLEITESVLIDEPHTTTQLLHALRSLGLHLSLDDFGTGYSSLAYLRLLPIKTLKIDRAFLTKDIDDHMAWTVLETIAALAQLLNLQMIVEGVESSAEAERLKTLGADGAQGYHYAKPLLFDETHLALQQQRGGPATPPDPSL